MGTQSLDSALAVLQLLGLFVLSLITYFLKRSLSDLDAVEEKVEALRRDAALREDVETVAETLRADSRALAERFETLNTTVAVIVDRDRMRRLEDYGKQQPRRRLKGDDGE